MNWYRLTGQHIKHYNETLKYLYTEEAMKSSDLIEQFYQTFVRSCDGKSGLKPNYNPCIHCEFKMSKKPKDLYTSLGKLSRHFIVSPRLYKIWSNYRLSDHVCLEGITFRNDTDKRNDYYYCHFNQSLGDNIDYEKSVFSIKSRETNEFIKEVKIVSEDDYERISGLNTRSQGTYLDIAELCIPGIYDFDLFFLMNIAMDTQAFISERLYKNMVKEKITGADMWLLDRYVITG